VDSRYAFSTQTRGFEQLYLDVSDRRFLRSLLRSDNFLLQNRAILRNAARINLPLVSSEKHAGQPQGKQRKKPSLIYESAALNQLSYAGVLHTKAVFSELIKSSS